MARREERLDGGSELPAPGVEERSDEAPGAGATSLGGVPGPEAAGSPGRLLSTMQSTAVVATSPVGLSPPRASDHVLLAVSATNRSTTSRRASSLLAPSTRRSR